MNRCTCPTSGCCRAAEVLRDAVILQRGAVELAVPSARCRMIQAVAHAQLADQAYIFGQLPVRELVDFRGFMRRSRVKSTGANSCSGSQPAGSRPRSSSTCWRPSVYLTSRSSRRSGSPPRRGRSIIARYGKWVIRAGRGSAFGFCGRGSFCAARSLMRCCGAGWCEASAIGRGISASGACLGSEKVFLHPGQCAFAATAPTYFGAPAHYPRISGHSSWA